MPFIRRIIMSVIKKKKKNDTQIVVANLFDYYKFYIFS